MTLTLTQSQARVVARVLNACFDANANFENLRFPNAVNFYWYADGAGYGVSVAGREVESYYSYSRFKAAYGV